MRYEKTKRRGKDTAALSRLILKNEGFTWLEWVVLMASIGIACVWATSSLIRYLALRQALMPERIDKVDRPGRPAKRFFNPSSVNH